MMAWCWNMLTMDERMAAMSLRYGHRSWNCFQPCEMPAIAKSEDDFTRCESAMLAIEDFYDRDYDRLTALEKDAWGALGVTQATWSRRNQRPPWDRLDRQEEAAAKFLRFSQLTWDRCAVPKTVVARYTHPTYPPPTPPPKEKLRTVKAELVCLARSFHHVSGMQAVFRKAVKQELAAAVGISEDRVLIIDVRKGSIVIEFIIRQDGR